MSDAPTRGRHRPGPQVHDVGQRRPRVGGGGDGRRGQSSVGAGRPGAGRRLVERGDGEGHHLRRGAIKQTQPTGGRCQPAERAGAAGTGKLARPGQSQLGQAGLRVDLVAAIPLVVEIVVVSIDAVERKLAVDRAGGWCLPGEHGHQSLDLTGLEPGAGRLCRGLAGPGRRRHRHRLARRGPGRTDQVGGRIGQRLGQVGLVQAGRIDLVDPSGDGPDGHAGPGPLGLGAHRVCDGVEREADAAHGRVVVGRVSRLRRQRGGRASTGDGGHERCGGVGWRSVAPGAAQDAGRVDGRRPRPLGRATVGHGAVVGL
jgi:hypothetical protein